MSVFSEKLQECITRSNIKIASLSKISGVERSYIQKMLTGERIPGDPEVLRQLADALMLTPSERRILTEAYAISKMGEVIYYRRLLVKRLIEGAGSSLIPSPVLRETFPDPCFSRPPVLTVSGKSSISDTLRLLMEEELSKEDPQIQAVLQPECDAAQVLLQYARICPRLQMEQIICLDSELQYQRENKYNLGCLQKIFGFLFGACRYSPYFYYESISSKTGISALFPWMIISRGWVFLLSGDGEHAVTVSDPDTVSHCGDIFSRMREECMPVIECSGNYWDPDNWETTGSSTSYSLQFEPCMGLFFTMDMARKQIPKEIPQRENLLKFLEERQKKITLLEGGRKNVSFFTLEGLDRFLETGRLSELPEHCYEPLPRAFRAELLRRMLACMKAGSYTPYCIQTAKFRVSENLSFFASGVREVLCTYRHPLYGLKSFQLHEKSIAYSFTDFFEYLKETGLILPLEETQSLLQNRFQKLFKG